MIPEKEIYIATSTSFENEIKKMITHFFAMDGLEIPEIANGELLKLFQKTSLLLTDINKINNRKELTNFIAHAIKTIGQKQRKGKYFFINHAGVISPKGIDLLWFLDNWINDAIKAVEKKDNNLLWNCLLDMEIIAPANAMNSTIAQIMWNCLRIMAGKSNAYVARKNMIQYQLMILKNRLDNEAYFTFKQKIQK